MKFNKNKIILLYKAFFEQTLLILQANNFAVSTFKIHYALQWFDKEILFKFIHTW